VIYVLIFAFLALLVVVFKVAEFSGFSKEDSLTITFISLLTSFFPPLDFCNFSGVEIYLSISGFVIPFAISIKQIATKNVSTVKAIVGVILLTLISHSVSVAGRGGVDIINPKLPVITATFYSLLVEREKPAVLSYTTSTLGMFVGADLMNLNSIKSNSVTIGGANLLDAIYISGIASLLLTFCIQVIIKSLNRKRKNSSEQKIKIQSYLVKEKL